MHQVVSKLDLATMEESARVWSYKLQLSDERICNSMRDGYALEDWFRDSVHV